MSRDLSPRPRVLFLGTPEEHVEQLSALAPTSGFQASSEKFHATDWDAVVVFDSAIPPAGPYHVLSFGASAFDAVLPAGRHEFERRQYTKARSIFVADSCPPSLAQLARSTLVDQLGPQSFDSDGERVTWKALKAGSGPYANATAAAARNAVTSIVEIGDECYVQSFITTRSSSSAGETHLWVLPRMTPSPHEWAASFLDFLRDEDPQAFPVSKSWRLDGIWAPPELKAAVEAVERVEVDRAEFLMALALREEAADAALTEAQQRAEKGPQRVLTDSGQSLVEAVATMLRAIGFDVEDMDDHHDEASGAKLEDLRVRDPDAPNWVSLVEVKGYSKGAKTSDIAQIIGRPAVAYAIETGMAPPAVWHIVNHWRHLDPGQRATAIPNDKIDLKSLTAANGILIDTRDLFRAWIDVESGVVQSEALRGALRSSKSRWTYQGVV